MAVAGESWRGMKERRREMAEVVAEVEAKDLRNDWAMQVTIVDMLPIGMQGAQEPSCRLQYI